MKEYVAMLKVKLWRKEIVIDKPILTTKDEELLKSKVDKNGKIRENNCLYPLLVEGNKSKILN